MDNASNSIFTAINVKLHRIYGQVREVKTDCCSCNYELIEEEDDI